MEIVMSRTVPVRAAALGGAVAVLLATVTACGSSAEEDRSPEHRSFALRGHTLTIDADDSALEVVAGSQQAGSIRVTQWFTGSVLLGEDPRATWDMRDGNRLVLRVRCRGLFPDCDARHRVEVPHGVTVKVEDENGRVRARGFKDALDIRTRNGSVHVTDTSGPLELHSDNGSVRAEVSSRRVRAGTLNGAVRLRLDAVPDKVGATSENGSVGITLPRAAYRVTTRSDNGPVDVSVPRDDSSPHTVSATTSNGRITVRTTG
ncbi:hypothetical protein STXM2123_4243 [Streptomyces sp. F-3]|jgi:hypothetical protein|nr:hypothetical protein STXM2123_4243 [Streptomyces sp. F-3]